MALDTLTLEEQHDFMIAHYRMLLPDMDVSEMSDNWLWLRTQAAAATDNHAHIKAIKADLLPWSARGITQEQWAEFSGVPRKGATGARKAEALRVFGTPTSPVPDSSELLHESGLRYRTSGAEVVGPLGWVDVDVAAISTGAATRLNAGERLTFTSAHAGLQDEAELQLDLDEDGTDQESEGEWAERIARRWYDEPAGGKATDYEKWATAETGIQEAYAYPLRRGLGSVDLAALHAGSGTARILSAPEVADLQATLDAKRPISVKAFRVLQVVGEPVNVEYDYVPNGEPQYEPDWDDQTPPEVDDWDAVDRILSLNVRPDSMKAGDRIVLSGGATGRERVIEALGPLDDQVVIEADDAGDIPAEDMLVYSGGPLVQPIRAAIIALIDSLGTANPDAKRYGTWDGSLRLGAIFRAVSAVEGHLDGEIDEPDETVEADDPAFPDDANIGLLVPGQILVRRKSSVVL